MLLNYENEMAEASFLAAVKGTYFFIKVSNSCCKEAQ